MDKLDLDKLGPATLPWIGEMRARAKARGVDGGMFPDGRFALELEHPVTFGSLEMRQLVFRPCTGADLRWFGGMEKVQDLGRLLELAARLTGCVDKQLDLLDVVDAHRCCEVAAAFFFGHRQMLGAAR